MKRVLSLVVVLILMISLSVPVYAADARGSYIGDDITVWICVCKEGGSAYESMNGHAWLIIENNTLLNFNFGD